MMYNSFLLFTSLFFIFFSNIFSQGVSGQPALSQNLKGKVFDFYTKSELPGATIKIVGSDPIIGVVTSLDGTFIFRNLPIGRYELEVTFVGYKSHLESNVMVGAGKEVELSIGMIEEVGTLDEIMVSGYRNKVEPTNQMAVVSARSISSDEAQRFAGSLDDPARMALSYAGVTSSNGHTNEIIVRGNSPKGLLWRLEGIEIPNPNHYAQEGSSGGFINILNSSNMARSDFFVSAFPSEFGNATSGIFDLKMRKGNADKREHAVEASTLGLRTSTEGPLGKNNGSYLVNYRYSTLGLIGNFAKDYDFPVFQDATFKINLPTKKMGNVSFFGLGGSGKWDEESTVGGTLSDGTEFAKSWTDRQHYDLGILGASQSLSFKNNKTYLENVVVISATQNRPSNSAFNYDLNEPYLEERGVYLNTAIRLASTLNHKLNAKNLITTGIKLNTLRYKLASESGLPDGTITKGLEKSGAANLFQGFLSWQFRPTNDWVINGGVHTTYFTLSKQAVIEPRVGVQRLIGENQSLSFGMGLHSRHESVATYYGERLDNGILIRPNQKLKLNQAAHFVVGHNVSLADNFHLKTEIYYQYQYHVPVEDNLASSYSSINHDVSFTTLNLVNKGVGYNYGTEVTLEKNFSKQYYFLITGSLFDSKYKALDGVWRNTRYNTNYATNLIGGKEFLFLNSIKRKAIGINLRAAYTGGKRVTPLDLQQSISAGYGVEIKDQAFTTKLSDYYRMDFSIYYKWDKKRTSHQLKLDILNLLEQNIYGIKFVAAKFGNPAYIKQYSYNEDDEKVSNLFPIFSYKVNF